MKETKKNNREGKYKLAGSKAAEAEMGIYINPGDSGFKRIRNGQYIDKTGLIAVINNVIDTLDNLICVSRARRFGKSLAAQMLCAYYDKTCDAAALFDDLEIAGDPSYKDHLNRYDVIYLDMTTMLGNSKPEELIRFTEESIIKGLREEYPEVNEERTVVETLTRTMRHTGNKFIVIIDEWDAPLRETPQIEKEYLQFLRTLFKGSGTTNQLFAAVYMTGILPIRKNGSQSAISDFREYTMLKPGKLARFTGFTEEEVRGLCDRNDLSFEKMAKWYDGYTVGRLCNIFNPYSVMSAVYWQEFESYWRKTSTAETLITYVDMDMDGLQADIVRLIAGEEIYIHTEGFQNDLSDLRDKDDILTLLVHLGYLTCEIEEEESGGSIRLVKIPNEEVRQEFRDMLRRARHRKLVSLVQESDQLLRDTVKGNESAVALAFEKLRDSEYAPTWYNNEQALRYFIKVAYISCVDQYAKVEEMPTGHGIADVVFVPRRRSQLPAMIVELKWNKTAENAIRQAKDRNYPAALKNYGGDILLIGVSYEEGTGRHSCRIEKVRT